MKISKNSIWLWLIVSVLLCIPLYFNISFYVESLFYPRDNIDVILGSILVFAMPFTIASVVKLRLEKPKLSNKTILSTLVFSFIANTILFFVTVFLLNVLDNSVIKRAAISEGLKIVIQIIILILALLPFLFSPFILSKKIIIKPWWSVLFLFIGVSALILVTKFSNLLTDFATFLGGHYYTWYNFMPVALIIVTVVAAGIRLGTCWVFQLENQVLDTENKKP